MNISIFVLPPFLTGLSTLALGLFVLFKSKSSDLARRFSLLCFSIMVWQFGNVLAWSSKTSDIALFWMRLVYIGVAFIPALAYHLSVSTNDLQKQKRWIPFAYLLSFLLLFLVFRKDFIIGVRETLWGRHQIAGKSHSLFLFFWTLPLILSVFNFYYGYRSTTSPFERQRRRLVSVGFFIACLAGIDYLPSYGVEIPYPLGFIFILFFIAFTTYASVYYRALNVEVILKKISIITFLSIVAAVIIYIAPFYLQSYFYRLWGKNWIFFPISLAFLVGIGLFRLINLVRDMEESELSKKFAYRPILKKEAERVSKARNIHELLTYLTRDLSHWVRLDYVGVLVWDNHTKKFVLHSSFTRVKNKEKIPTGLTLSQDNPLIVELLRKRRPVVYSELKYHLDTEATQSEERGFLSKITDQMQRLGAEVALPCFCEDKLLALINIGHKLNLNDIITNEDLELFSSLSNHTARALHGFMLHEEKIELIVASQNTLISAIEAKDRYTRGHTDRVAEYCILIGKRLEKELRFYPNGLSDLKWAAQLHDVGKIGISDKILLKKGPLDEDEWQVIKEHPINGIRIISPVREWLGEDICAGILYHHENFDGSGYPSQQKGEEIHLFAQIIRVADAFDAMIIHRPYRPALTKEEAINELKKYKSIHFAPQIVDVMVNLYNAGEI